MRRRVAVVLLAVLVSAFGTVGWKWDRHVNRPQQFAGWTWDEGATDSGGWVWTEDPPADEPPVA